MPLCIKCYKVEVGPNEVYCPDCRPAKDYPENTPEGIVIGTSEGKMVCRIQPHSHLADIVGIQNIWRRPDIVTQWARSQAWIVDRSLTRKGIPKGVGKVPWDFRCLCITCGQETFGPMGKHWLWSSKYKHIGYSCQNGGCRMNGILLPNVMIVSLNGMPKQYADALTNLANRYGL